MKYKIMFMALLAMCACAFLVNQADESNAETITGSCGTNLTYSYDTDTTVLTISGSGTTLTAPNYNMGGGVTWGTTQRDTRVASTMTEVVWNTPNLTTLNSRSFALCTALVKATLPPTVTTLSSNMWYGCTGLKEVDISNHITLEGYSIEQLFWDCTSLETVNMPNVIGFWNGLFAGCTSLEYITIPEGVIGLNKSIARGCFEGCTNLKEVTLPSTLTRIDNQAFYNCSSLNNLTIPESVSTIGKQAFQNCASLTSIVIPENVTIINEACFKGCTKLADVSLPNSIITIGLSAFESCTSLTSATIPENTTTLGNMAYYGTNLTEITYNAQAVSAAYSIYSGPFYNIRSVQNITIGENVQSIPHLMFSYLFNTTITLHWNAIDCEDFDSGQQRFSRISTIIFGDNVQHIPAYLCEDMKATLESVSFNDGLESIGAHAFDGCTNLAMVGLPDSVTEIGQQAFYGCTGILMPNLPSGIVNIHTGAFSGCPGVSISYLPATIEMIGKEAFRGCTAITKMVIPVGFDGTIGVNAFTDCTELSKILNLSELDIQLGSEDNGHIAYYADEVRDNIGSTAIVQQKQNVIHEVIEKSDAASKLLRVLPALMAIAVISFLCGLFYYRETERNKI